MPNTASNRGKLAGIHHAGIDHIGNLSHGCRSRGAEPINPQACVTSSFRLIWRWKDSRAFSNSEMSLKDEVNRRD